MELENDRLLRRVENTLDSIATNISCIASYPALEEYFMNILRDLLFEFLLNYLLSHSNKLKTISFQHKFGFLINRFSFIGETTKEILRDASKTEEKN